MPIFLHVLCDVMQMKAIIKSEIAAAIASQTKVLKTHENDIISLKAQQKKCSAEVQDLRKDMKSMNEKVSSHRLNYFEFMLNMIYFILYLQMASGFDSVQNGFSDIKQMILEQSQQMKLFSQNQSGGLEHQQGIAMSQRLAAVDVRTPAPYEHLAGQKNTPSPPLQPHFYFYHPTPTNL